MYVITNGFTCVDCRLLVSLWTILWAYGGLWCRLLSGHTFVCYRQGFSFNFNHSIGYTKNLFNIKRSTMVHSMLGKVRNRNILGNIWTDELTWLRTTLRVPLDLEGVGVPSFSYKPKISRLIDGPRTGVVGLQGNWGLIVAGIPFLLSMTDSYTL